MPADTPPTFGAPPVRPVDEVRLTDDVVELDDTTELDDLEAELGDAAVPTVVIPVPGRPRYSLECRLDFTDKDLDKWRKGAKDKSYADGVSGTKFAALLIASTCLRVLRDGETLEVEGKTASFTSRPFLELLKATTAVAGVRTLFRRLEGPMQQAAGAVQRAAGWLDPIEETTPDGVDPS